MYVVLLSDAAKAVFTPEKVRSRIRRADRFVCMLVISPTKTSGAPRLQQHRTGGSYHGRSAGDGAAGAPPAGIVVAVDRGTVGRLGVQLYT